MGIDLTYRADDREFGIRFSHADWDTIEHLKAYLPAAVADCFEVANLGEPVVVALAALCSSIEQIDTLLKDRPHLLPLTYQFKPEYLQCGTDRLDIKFDFGTGGQGGIQLPGDEVHWYSIWAGLNELRLEKLFFPPGERGKVVDVRDLRGENELIDFELRSHQISKAAGEEQFVERAQGDAGVSFGNTVDGGYESAGLMMLISACEK